MNMRIQKIYQEARGISLMSPNFMEEWEYKFAELIIQECLNEIEGQIHGGRELEDGTHSLDWDAALECVDAMIRHRFGLKREILDTVISDDNKPQGSVTYTIEKGA